MLKRATTAIATGILVAGIVVAGCSKGAAKKPDADSVAMDRMPGMEGTPGMARAGDTAAKGELESDKAAGSVPASLEVTSAQIAHGKVQWAAAIAGSASRTASIPGQITPDEDRTARLGAPARGRVIAVRVNPGDAVRSGQVLVQIQSPDAGSAQSDLAKAAAMVTSRRGQAQYARAARDRAERLLGLKAIPRQDYEKAVADDEMAQAELREAEAELSRARTAADQIGADLEANGMIQIRAPHDGVILTRSAVPGTFIEAGSPLLAITDPSQLWLVVNAPEQFSGLFRQGSAIRFTVPAYADTFSARITSLGAGLDADTRTLPVRASVDSRGGRLKPGMLATAIAAAPSAGAAILVPEEAVQTVLGKPHVFVVALDAKGGARLERREIELGPRANGRVAVLRGLRANELVVTRGSFLVKSAFLKGGMSGVEM